MTFTDDDLRRLKKQMNQAEYGWDSVDCFGFKECEALLARLEAAESALKHGNTENCHWREDSSCYCTGYDNDFEAWRKATGK